GSGDAFAHWNYSLPGLVDGANSFTLTAVDAAVPPNETSMGFMVFRIADPEGSSGTPGVADLLHHAFNLGAVGVGRDGMPSVRAEVHPGDGKRYLTVTYRRRIQAAGFRYFVETSETLQPPWNDTGSDVQEVSVLPNGDGVTESVTLRITPAVVDGLRKFVRVRVELD
ncbi:MAG: hypothetical protein KDK99_10470, partial [Verrucomicrobiales bacterium]|nr:hypothetical protein [Verrucomicrobiales bacterium]